MTGTLKSKDIDIIVDFEDVAELKTALWTKKNPLLKNYERS